MRLKINKPRHTTFKNNTVWITCAARSEQSDVKTEGGSIPTISCRVTSSDKSKEAMEETMNHVITKNKELYKRLAK